jgi:aromatic-L-amino-acid decarboxylase
VPGKSQDMDELNSLNKELISKINSSGKIFLTHTKLNEKFVVRLVVSGIRTYESHVRMAYDIIKKSLQEIMKEKES